MTRPKALICFSLLKLRSYSRLFDATGSSVPTEPSASACAQEGTVKDARLGNRRQELVLEGAEHGATLLGRERDVCMASIRCLRTASLRASDTLASSCRPRLAISISPQLFKAVPLYGPGENEWAAS